VGDCFSQVGGRGYQTGKNIAFGRVTDEIGWFVDDQQVRVFVNDVE
jgi:hypothetical protein